MIRILRTNEVRDTKYIPRDLDQAEYYDPSKVKAPFRQLLRALPKDTEAIKAYPKLIGSSPNRVGNFWRFSLPSFVRRGRSSVTPQERLATFPTVEKTHQPLLQRAFQEITRPNLPTHLGEDPLNFLRMILHGFPAETKNCGGLWSRVKK